MKISIFLLSFFLTFLIFSQEVKINVTINTDKIDIRDKGIFDNFRENVEQFINSTKWTNDMFEEHEKIECNFQFIVDNMLSNNDFEMSLQVISRRPVYNTSYKSTVFNINDKSISVTYQENARIEYIENQYTTELASIISFYVYTVLGFDYDSFSKEGGTNYFLKARDIAQNALNNSTSEGWSPARNNNRYWLITDILKEQFEPFRWFYYEYHIHGMDVLYASKHKAMENITKSFEYLREVHSNTPLSYNMQLLFQAKIDEIINLYTSANSAQKKDVLSILKLVNPANINRYNTLSE